MTEPFVRWDSPDEADAAAEAVWIEHEMQVRGDGMFRPWNDLHPDDRERWRRVAEAVLRTMNQRRGQAIPKRKRDTL